jgi:phage tail sheath protein FI
MTQADLLNGRLVCLIGVAPLKPAEFMILNFTLTAVPAE